MNQLSAVVVKELDVSVLLCSDGDWKSGVAEHFVDLTGSAWLNIDEQMRLHTARTTLTTTALMSADIKTI